MINLILVECIEKMKNIPGKSIDFILCDLPYGTTSMKWDCPIPFEDLWKEYKRIIKDDHVICLFGSEPFSSHLRLSNFDWFKYDWVWKKTKALGFAHAKNSPMKIHEIISVFSSGNIKHEGQKNRMPYNPQGLLPYGKLVNGKNKFCKADITGHRFSRPSNKYYTREFTNYPSSVLEFNNEGNTVHPTQKSVDLLEYLIKTYTNENDLVLDNTMGSGSTGVACVNTNRNFIGIELKEEYFNIAKDRIDKAIEQKI